MLDIGKIHEDPTEIQVVYIAPAPLFVQCVLNHRYTPGFPFFLDGLLMGYLCGSCITDFVEALVVKNPSVTIMDTRKILYN